MSIKIVIDATASVTQKFAQDNDIEVLPIRMLFGQKECSIKYFDESENQYEKILNGEIPKTSLPSPAEFGAVFYDMVSAGHDVICITMSSEISGTYNSARIAAAYFGDKVCVLDSGTTAHGILMVIEEVIEIIKTGACLKEVTEQAKKICDKVKIFFIPGTLENLRQGGRLGLIKQTIISLLRIKPVISLYNNKMTVAKKAIGMKFAVGELVQMIPESKKIVALKIGENDFFSVMKEKIKGKLGIKRLNESELSTVVASHIGPGAIGIAVLEK